MPSLTKGRYVARFAEGVRDLRAAQALRHLCFHGRPGLDADDFDSACRHLLVEELASGDLVCCLRLLPLKSGAGIQDSYSAQHYDLTALSAFDQPMAEIGRFCIHPARHDPDILRIAWGALTQFVDSARVGMLFGCSSFRGIDPSVHLDAFARLRDRHLGPGRWRPQVKSAAVLRFGPDLRGPDPRRAMLAMPPLLRTYLVMGGWVSDHAVIDAGMNTMHVFTGLEIAAIPEGRARVLRGLGA